MTKVFLLLLLLSILLLCGQAQIPQLYNTLTFPAPFGATVVGTAGNYVIFAGNTSVLEIYNTSNGTWTNTTFAGSRGNISVVSIGTKIFFGGGYTNGQGASPEVDIYDITAPSWNALTQTNFPSGVARYLMGSTAVNGFAIFVGGMTSTLGSSNVVDIYNYTKGGWVSKPPSLTKARSQIACAAVGNQAVCAGGYDYGTDTYFTDVDIFDTTTLQWTSSINNLLSPAGGMTATTVGNSVFFGFGSTTSHLPSPVIWIFDANNSTFTSQATVGCISAVATTVNDRWVVFQIYEKLLTYDSQNTLWTEVALLPQNLTSPAITSVGPVVFIGGGTIGSEAVFSNTLYMYYLGTPPCPINLPIRCSNSQCKRSPTECIAF